MSEVSLDNVTSKEFFRAVAENPALLPIRFPYDGKEYQELQKGFKIHIDGKKMPDV